MTDAWTPFIAIGLSSATLALALITAWVRLNSANAKIEVKALADKVACDASMSLLRAEVVAVERRSELAVQGVVAQLQPQLNRIEERFDRLLERTAV